MKYLPLVLTLWLSACLAQPTAEPTATIRPPQILRAEQNPYAPQVGDVGLGRAGIVLTAIQLSERTDLDPSRVQVNFLGSMPKTCNQLRFKVAPPDREYRIFIEAYSLIDPNASCENFFQRFETHIVLGAYSPGRYTIWVNEQYVGDFVSY